MLIFERAVFLHVPKTGGIWARNAIRASGCKVRGYTASGDVYHGDLSYCPHVDRFLFAFVRHPLTLYRSYWRFKIGAGWDPLNPFDQDCAADSFPVFVSRVLTQYPGWCSSMFDDYVGPRGRPIPFVGRFETLVDDLIKALQLTGETFSESIVRATPPANVSQPFPAPWTPTLFEAVVQSEAEALGRFGYEPDPRLCGL